MTAHHLFITALVLTGCLAPPPAASEARGDASMTDDSTAAFEDRGGDRGGMSRDVGQADGRFDVSASRDADDDAVEAGPDLTINEEWTFQDGSAPNAEYDGTRDTELRRRDPTGNYGDLDDLEVKGTDGQHLLFGWDVSDIPPGSIVENAHIIFTSTSNSRGSENDVYPVNVAWAEDEATWNEARTGMPWEIPGCLGDGDRGPETFGTIEAPGPNIVMQVGPNDEINARVQQWIDDPASNHGVAVQRVESNDGLHIHSREAAEVDVRPVLVVEITRTP